MDEVTAEFVLSGPEFSQERLIIPRSEFFFGRTSDNDQTLSHSQISRQHFRIFWQDGGFWVEDVGSTNGTRVNRERVTAQVPKRINPTDVIQAGPFSLVYDRLKQPTDIQPQADLYADVPAPGLIEEIAPRPPRRQPPPKLAPSDIGVQITPKRRQVLNGLTPERSNWLEYLPGLYSSPDFDPLQFVGRFLLVFESITNPIIWTIDNFDLYLSAKTAPDDWMQWMASWFDMTLFYEVPVERRREILSQIGWLFMRRGTKAGLERLLRLMFDVQPEIIESTTEACHFTVRLPLSQSDLDVDAELVEYLIESQKPAFTSYSLEIT